MKVIKYVFTHYTQSLKEYILSTIQHQHQMNVLRFGVEFASFGFRLDMDIVMTYYSEFASDSDNFEWFWMRHF